MSKRPGKPSEWPLADSVARTPRTPQDALELDAEARLLGVRFLVVCPRCGVRTETGRGHFESIDCALRSGEVRPREVDLDRLLELASSSPAAGYDEELEAELAAARLSKSPIALEVAEAKVASRRPPPSPPPEPEVPDELRLRDATSRLSGRGTREVCPLCGEGFIAGKGHLGSDFCLVKRTIKQQAAEGFVRVDVWQWSKKILAAAGVEVRTLPGRLEPTTAGRPFRGVVAGMAPYAPRWALRVLRATKGWKRERRLRLLEVLQEPEAAEVLEFVKRSKKVPRGLLSTATELRHTTRARLLQRWEYGQRHPDALISPKVDATGRRK